MSEETQAAEAESNNTVDLSEGIDLDSVDHGDWKSVVEAAGEGEREMNTAVKKGRKLAKELEAELEAQEDLEADEAEIEDEEVSYDEGDHKEKEELYELEDADPSEELDEQRSVDDSEQTTEHVQGFTFSANGEEFVLPDDAKITIPVDGQPTEITLQEFANGISGQKALQQRFSVLDNERKQVESQWNNWNDNVGQFNKIREEQGYLASIDYLLATAGLSTDEHLHGVIQELTPRIQEYMQLDPEQRARRAAQAQAERHKQQLEAAHREAEQLRQSQQTEVQIRQVQATYGLDDDSFAEFYYALENEMQQGTLTARPITPELVGQYKVLREREGWAQQALADVAPAYAQNSEAVTRLSSMASAMGQNGQPVTYETMLMFAQEVYGVLGKTEKSKNLSKSLKKKGQKPLTKKSKVKAPQRPQTKTKNTLKMENQGMPSWIVKELSESE